MNVLAVVVVGEQVVGEPGPDVLTALGGVPIVVRSVGGLLDVPGIDHVDLLVPARLPAPVAQACAGMPVTLHDSAAGLWAHAGQRSGYTDGDGRITDRACILVHDAMRPLSPPPLTSAVIAAVRAGHRCVVPVLPLSDTVKDVDAGGLLRGTPDRSGLRVVQTPQGFRGDLRPTLAPDPGRAWSTVAGPAHVVPGHPLAFPVRHGWDLELAGTTIGASA